MGELDHGAKLALRIEPTSIIRLGLPGAEDVRPFPAEVISAQRTADGAFLATVGDEEVAVHVEVEAEPTSDASERVARAACALYVAHGRPVRPIVYYLHESAERRRPKDRFVLPIGEPPPTLRFRRVAVWELDPEDALSSGSAGLLPFVGLMRGATLEHVRRASRALDAAGLDTSSRADMEAALYFLSSCKFDRASLGGIIRTEALMASPGFQWAVEMGVVKGVRRTLARWIEARLGSVPQEVQRALDETDDPVLLERAAEALGRLGPDGDVSATVLDALGRRP